MRHRVASLCFISVLALGSVVPAQVTLVASSEYRPALEEVRKAFTAQTGVPTRVTYGSSGAMAQAAKVAGIDLYLASNKAWADSVAATSRSEESPLVLASIPVGVWVRGSVTMPDPRLQHLTRESVGRIAIPDTLLSPDGALVAHALHSLPNWVDIRKKLVMLPNPAVVSDSLSVPVTAPAAPDDTSVVDSSKLDSSKTDSAKKDSAKIDTTSKPKDSAAKLAGTKSKDSGKGKDTAKKGKVLAVPLTDGFLPQPLLWNTTVAGMGRWVALDPSIAPPMTPSVVRLKSINPTRAEATKSFLVFLQSPKGRSILRAYGFQPPPQ